MPKPVDNLVAFVQQRRAAMGLGHNALARASGLDPGTLANLMVGRIKRAPSLATLQKLATGLACDPQLLIAIVSAQITEIAGLARNPEGWQSQIVSRDARRGRGDFPLTEAEIAVLGQAEKIGLHWGIAQMPEFLDIPPSERLAMFKEFEGVVHSVRIHKRLSALDKRA